MTQALLQEHFNHFVAEQGDNLFNPINFTNYLGVPDDPGTWDLTTKIMRV